MNQVSVSSKGQVVIPKSIRQQMGITAGTRLELSRKANELTLKVIGGRKRSTVEEGIGLAGYKGPPVSIEQMDEGVRRYFRSKWKRAK